MDAVDEARRAAEADMEDDAAWREKKALRDAALDALDKVVMDRDGKGEEEVGKSEGQMEERGWKLKNSTLKRLQELTVMQMLIVLWQINSIHKLPKTGGNSIHAAAIHHQRHQVRH